MWATLFVESSQQNSRPSLPAPEVQALEPFSGGAQLCSEWPAHKTAVLHYAITTCKSCATTSNISIHFMQHIHSILKCSIPFPASPPSVTKQRVWPQHFLQVGLRLALQPRFPQEFTSLTRCHVKFKDSTYHPHVSTTFIVCVSRIFASQTLDRSKISKVLGHA